MEHQTVLITGGAGFVGANLAFYLQERGFNVIVLDNLVRRGVENNLEDFKKKGIKFIHGDIRCNEDLKDIKCDVICECSAQPSATDGYNNPFFDFSNNTVGLLNVLEMARIQECTVIFWSTNKTYSSNIVNQFPLKETDTRYIWDSEKSANINVPGWDILHGFSNDLTVDGGQHSIYGLTKIMSDLACQEYYNAFNVKTVVNRFSCLAGERQWGKCSQGWVAWWAIAAYFNMSLKYIGWKGKQVRDILFIEDICRLIEIEIHKIDEISGQVFNIGGGYNNTMSLQEATTLMEKYFDIEINTIMIDDPRKADHCIYISDIRKAKEILGWEPSVDIPTGYSRIIKWIKSNENILRRLYF